MNTIEQRFFTALEKKLWTAADQLRSNLDADDYEGILRLSAGAVQVEPGRIALMAEERAASIAKNKVADWEPCDAVQARLRNVVRVVLRKYGYPQALREQVAEQVPALARLTDGGAA